MSYVRWSEHSDLYAYESDAGFQIHVTDGQDFTLETEEEMCDVIVDLAEQGQKVPEALLKEARETAGR